MHKYIYIGLFVLLCTGRASAQFTLVSGTVTDTNGLAYACGTISASIVNANGQSLYLNGVQFSPSPSATKLGCPTDPNTSRTPGAFTVQLADNSQIKCGSGASIVTCATQTQWFFTINITGVAPPIGTGPQVCTTQTTISGTSQSISGNLAACPALSNPGSSAGAGGFTVFATQLAANAGQTLYMDTLEAGSNGCSLAGSPAIITCTTNTFICPNDAAPPAKLVWAVSSGTPGALALGTSTIVVCTDSLHATASTNTIIAGAVSNIRIGHDDTPAWDAVNSAYNALLITRGACLLLPAGLSTVKHGTLLVNPTGGYVGQGAYAPCWESLGLTYFSPTPDYNFAFFNPGANNIQFIGWGVGVCCKVGPPEQPFAKGIIVDGGQLATGTGVCTMGVGQQGMFLSQMHSEKLGVNGWCDGVNNFTPVTIDNLGNHFDISANNSGSSGGLLINTGSNANAPANIYGGQITCNQGNPAQDIFAAVFQGNPNTHNLEFTCAKTAITFASGPASTSVWHSTRDSFLQSPPGQTRPLIDIQGGFAWFTDCWAQSTAGNQILRTNGAGTVHMKGCTFNAAAGQFWADSHTVPGGTIYDDGGMSIIGSFASDAIPTGRNGIWGIGTGVGTANTTLFLVAQDSTNPAFTNTVATTVSGTAAFTGTIANLVCTSTAAGVNASSGVVTVRTAPLSTGTFAATTLTATFGTTTSAKDQTHTAAVTQGQPIQFQITTQVAETLAGVQCRVSEY